MNRRWVCGVLLTGALSTLGVGCAQTKQAAQVEYTTETWRFARQDGTKITTPHYAIYTTLSDPVLIDALPTFVETAYQYYQQLIPPAHEPNAPLRIYLFAARGEWEAFTRRFTGERSETFLQIRNGGYAERGVSVIQFVTNGITFPLFAHEGFHQYMQECGTGALPAWLNEGLAVYCEGQRWGMKSIREFDPWFNPRRHNDLAEAIQRDELLPLRELLRTNPGEVIYGTSRSIMTYYAQVWALVLFLQHGADGVYADGFHRMLNNINDPMLSQRAAASFIWSEEDSYNYGEALFRTFISEDIAQVEDQYRAFVRAQFLAR